MIDVRYEGEEEGTTSDVSGDWKSLQPREACLRGRSSDDYRERAAQVYDEYPRFTNALQVVRPGLFTEPEARSGCRCQAYWRDAMVDCTDWDPASDAKLNALHKLLTMHHPGEKVLVFTQFADTVRYLETQLAARGWPTWLASPGIRRTPPGWPGVSAR